jgi:hypothetical protein
MVAFFTGIVNDVHWPVYHPGSGSAFPLRINLAHGIIAGGYQHSAKK